MNKYRVDRIDLKFEVRPSSVQVKYEVIYGSRIPSLPI